MRARHSIPLVPRRSGLAIARRWLLAVRDEYLIWLVLIGPFAITATNRIVDKAQTLYDANGVAYAVGGGGKATMILTLVTTVSTMLCSIAIVLRGLTHGIGRFTPVALYGVVSLVAAIGRDSGPTVLGSLTGACVCLASGFLRVGRDQLGILGRFCALNAFFTLAYSLAYPSIAWDTCRADKCSIGGRLLQGVFWAENSLCVYFLLLLPSVAFVRMALARRVGLGLTIACILLTGSRAGYLALVLALMAYGLIRLMLDTPDDGAGELQWQDPYSRFRLVRPLTRALAALPLVMLAVSGIVMLVLPPNGLTDRGSVYAAIRRVLPQDPLLGPGLEAIRQVYYKGHALFLMNSEHGEVPHVVNTKGFLGLFLFTIILFLMWRRSRSWLGAIAGLLIAGPSVFFVTESSVEATFRGELWPLLILGVILATPQMPRMIRPRRTDQGFVPLAPPRLLKAILALFRAEPLVGILSLIGLLIGFGWTATSPVHYQAETRVAITVDLDRALPQQGNNDPVALLNQSADLVLSLAQAPSLVQGQSVSEDLASRISISRPGPSVVRVQVTDPSPEVARVYADRIATNTVARAKGLSSLDATVTQLGRPLMSIVPKDWLLPPLAALLGGFVVGVGTVLWRQDTPRRPFESPGASIKSSSIVGIGSP